MIGAQWAKGYGNAPHFGAFSFGPNGSTDPVISGSSSTLTGGLARWVDSITYSATGVQTIVFKEGFGSGGDMKFIIKPQPESLAEFFFADQIGAYNASTRTLVLTTHRSGTGREVPASANTRVHVVLVTNDSGAP